MERAKWLKKMRMRVETLYDHFAPNYWTRWGVKIEPVHGQFIQKFLDRLGRDSRILDAGCGAGLYEGALIEAGQRVVAIDQSSGMLARARGHYPADGFPGLHFEKKSMQEMNFKAEFDGAICVDALEHIFPEDWPGIMVSFQRALKPGGIFYFTMDSPDWPAIKVSYERAKELGLPVVPGEVADGIDELYSKVNVPEIQSVPGEAADRAVYHFYPTRGQVKAWLKKAGLLLVEEGRGDGYEHFLALRTQE